MRLICFSMFICLSASLTFGVDSFCEVCWCRDSTITCDDPNVITTLVRNRSALSDEEVSNVSTMYVFIFHFIFRWHIKCMFQVSFFFTSY